MKLNELLRKCADYAIDIQKGNGSFPAGHNGPWNDTDTPVRVTAHWSVLLTHAFQNSGESKYRLAAEKCASYLCSKESIPSIAFYCRKTKSKTNGLIGQAWALEGLCKLAEILESEKLLVLAEKNILQHRFDEALGLWQNMDIYGRPQNLNRVLNQQIFFGAVASSIANRTGNVSIKKKIARFVQELPKHLSVKQNRFEHLISSSNGLFPKSAFRFILRKAASFRFRKKGLNSITKGYCSFVLYGLANLRQQQPAIDLWQENGISLPILTVLKSFPAECLAETSDPDDFLWAYNPTGLEIAYALDVFGMNGSTHWVQEQLNRHFDFDRMSLTRTTSDPDTLSARIYEATLLHDRELDFD